MPLRSQRAANVTQLSSPYEMLITGKGRGNVNKKKKPEMLAYLGFGFWFCVWPVS